MSAKECAKRMFVVVVKKYASDTARFVAVRDKKNIHRRPF